MMTPMFLNQTNTEYFDLNQDSHEDRQQLVLESPPFYPSYISASDISSLHLEPGLDISDQSLTFDQLDMTSTNNYGSHNHEIFTFKQQEDQEPNNQNNVGGIATENGSSLRWMTSKMRMMRRMINSNSTKSGPTNGSRIIPASNNPDQGPQVNATFNTDIDNNEIRVCSDCNTTKTPLWRSGPQGPKTLCNACGIRQRKARKAAMEALSIAAAKNSSCEAASSSTSTKTTIKLKINKEKNKSRATSNTCVSKHINKKQTTCNKQEANKLIVESDHNNSSSTISNSSKRQMVFEEFAVNFLSKNAAFHNMFPKDEEEGALLLMALSYGLIET